MSLVTGLICGTIAAAYEARVTIARGLPVNVYDAVGNAFIGFIIGSCFPIIVPVVLAASAGILLAKHI